MKNAILSFLGFIDFGLILVFLEICSRKRHWSADATRRTAHIIGSCFAVFFSAILTAPFFLGIVGGYFLVMLISHKWKIFGHIHKVSRKTIGEELLPLGFIITYCIAKGNSTIFMPAFLIVGFADPIKGILVQKYKNSFLASLIFIIITSLLLLLFPHTTVLISILVAVTLNTLEQISGHGTDNLTLPVATALILLLL